LNTTATAGNVGTANEEAAAAADDDDDDGDDVVGEEYGEAPLSFPPCLATEPPS